MQNENEAKYCPLIKETCLKEKCAWWIEEQKYCAIVEISQTIS